MKTQHSSRPVQEWATHAARLASKLPLGPAWRGLVATTQRHLFVPRWWARTDSMWELRDGPADPWRWMFTAYEDRSLVTRIGNLHAEDSVPGRLVPALRAQTSATAPSLLLSLVQHAMIMDRSRVLMTTNSGYGAALLCRRLGARHNTAVTAVNPDPVLTSTVRERLAELGLHPTVDTRSITGRQAGTYDRIVSTLAVKQIPKLTVLRTGGRFVTPLTGTGLIVTAIKQGDGSAAGHLVHCPAAWTAAREEHDQAPGIDRLVQYRTAKAEDGEHISTGRYPALHVPDAWDLWSMTTLTVPGISYHLRDTPRGRTYVLLHPDRSWARIEQHGAEPPVVHQSGPRRLWNLVEQIRARLTTTGPLPATGMPVHITPNGICLIQRDTRHDTWTLTLPTARTT